jgi:hypothetical protein
MHRTDSIPVLSEKIPPIDRHVRAEFETATFALG